MGAGPLYRTLPTARLSFGGDKLEIRQGNQRRYAALVDIKEYADAVEPGILNALLYEASEFIETQSFSLLPRRDAIRALELQRDQLIASDDVVASQVAEMDVALNELGDGQFSMGEYHYSLIVFGEDVADAGRRAAQAIGAVGEASSLQMAPVDLVADAAWFAQMPGNWQWRPRDAKLSSRAFAALASAHNFPQGKRNGNPWGEALALLRTTVRATVLPEPAQQPRGRGFAGQEAAGQHADHRLDRRGQDHAGDVPADPDPQVGRRRRAWCCSTWTAAARSLSAPLVGATSRWRLASRRAATRCNANPTPARIQFWEQLIKTCIVSTALPLMPADERAIADAVKSVAMMPAPLRRFLHPPSEPAEGGRQQPLRATGTLVSGRVRSAGSSTRQTTDSWRWTRPRSSAFDTTEFLDLPEVRTPVMMYLLQVIGRARQR